MTLPVRRDPPALRGRPRAAVLALAALAAVSLLAGCSSGPIVANAPAAHPGEPSPSPVPSTLPDPQPIVFPRDDGAHHRLTEWWYYTGHLQDTQTGKWYGFEDVVFRAERGAFPISWASHLAITDESGDRFVYAQRSQVGGTVDVTASAPAGPDGAHPAFAFSLTGFDPSRPATYGQPAWTMAGGGGHDRLAVTLSAAEASAAGSPGGMGLGLALDATGPPTLHDGDGWVDFGEAGGSYYYSRTRMTATGTIVVAGRTHEVRGTAWFDHQWGDFIAVGGGGWDWFAMSLDDGTDVTLSLVRAQDGTYPLVYGTIASNGTSRHLDASAFTVEATSHWTSPRTGATYPSGWRISIPGEGLSLEVTPTVLDQELDTRATTGVVYWEGSQLVRGTRDGRAVGGRGYVELTGYAPTAGR